MKYIRKERKKERLRENELEHKLSLTHWFFSQGATMARNELDQSQKSGILLRSLVWVAGPQVLGTSSAAIPGTINESLVGSKVAGTPTITDVECQCFKQ